MTAHLSTGIDMFSKGLNHNHPQIHWLWSPRAHTVPTSTGSSFPGFHSYQGYPTTSHLAAQRTLKALNHQCCLGSPQKHHWRNSRFSVAQGLLGHQVDTGELRGPACLGQEPSKGTVEGRTLLCSLACLHPLRPDSTQQKMALRNSTFMRPYLH